MASRAKRGAQRGAAERSSKDGPGSPLAKSLRAQLTGPWLVKSEPSTYSWDDLVRDGQTVWDGVRNPEARNHLAAMRRGDAVLFYHSGDDKAVVGRASCVREAFPDPKADDPKWLAVELAAGKPLARAVTLSEIKADAKLAKIPLVTRSRLSVMPIDAASFERIVAHGSRK